MPTVRTAILGIALALDQPAALEPVDERDHRRPIQAHARA
jgi:hypothetical protein